MLAATSPVVVPLAPTLVGEIRMRMGCGYDADRFAMEIFAKAIRHREGPNSQVVT